ncbi:MAG: hypothetical protein UZ01_03609 [Candidatus Brocadia sinica]|nr:MAG: hypothetical protein UZ01_03609 [Candidatus Brocadia sinica]NUO04029.1 hypothetical protein [Candidatus Brocadia sinica]
MSKDNRKLFDLEERFIDFAVRIIRTKEDKKTHNSKFLVRYSIFVIQ